MKKKKSNLRPPSPGLCIFDHFTELMQYKLKTLFSSGFLLFASYAFSQSSLFSYEKFIGDSGDTLPYRQLISDYNKVSQYPLVIFLHGRGESGTDNEAQLKWGVQNFATDQVMKKHKPIVIAPQCPDDDSWGGLTYDKAPVRGPETKSMKLLLALIDTKIKTMQVDPSRVYITGLSMGGFGTYDAISRRPELFAAAVPVCGGGDTSLAGNFAHIPMWIFHGADDDVVPANFSLEMELALKRAGANPGLTIYPDTGHFSWLGAYDDEMMMEWLFSQVKNK